MIVILSKVSQVGTLLGYIRKEALDVRNNRCHSYFVFRNRIEKVS